MNNICLKNAFYILLCCILTTFYSSSLDKTLTAKELPKKNFTKSSLNDSESYNKQHSILIDKQTNYCQSISADYQEFYNFETINHNIGICHKEEKWFYYRKSKSDPNSFLFLPAQIVFGGDFFKAIDKKTTYFVGINSNGYYSSVMYGNNQIVFEPELPTTPMITKNKDNITPVEEFVPKSLDFQGASSNSSTDIKFEE